MPINAITNAKNDRIKTALTESDLTQFINGAIINPANRYIGFNTHLSDIETNPNNIRHQDLAEYIGISILSHCYDGWNFLSRGVEALVKGDISSCIHFIYYSELRAAMSIMAQEGIGVFENKHLYYDRHSNPHIFKGPTHLTVDQLMTEWAKNGSRKETVFETIKLNNHSLKNWITATGSSSSGAYANSLLEEWLSNWSIDLRFESDKKLRNEMSYRPHFEIPPISIPPLLDQLSEIWLSLEPIDSNRFPNLDMHLSRIAIEKLYLQTTGNLPTHTGFENYLKNTFETIGEPVKQKLFEFILRRSSPDDHIIIREASRDITNNRMNLTDPIPMICRSLLLLRFATGFANQIMVGSNVDLKHLKFWWQDIAIKIGIIESSSDIETFDLYADIQESINSLKDSGISSIFETNLFGYPDLVNLKQFQRICFWGLGI